MTELQAQIGLLGGTFDPIHVGHLRLAEEAREQLALDRVLFIPAPRPWRKAGRPITSVAHRLAMVHLGIDGNAAFDVSTVELNQEGPTYTALTLAALHEEFQNSVFHFILGWDALRDLPNWHAPQQIVALSRLALVARAAGEAPDLAALERRVPGLSNAVERLEMPRLDVSSTDIRHRVASGRSVRYLVPDTVATYIADHGLYRGEA